MTENELFGNSEQLEASYKKDHVADPGKMVGDLISRQAALDSVIMGALSTATLYGRTDEGATALKETVRAINELPSAQQGWIPCEERLPGEDDSFYVLCCDTHGEVMIGHVFVCKDGEETPYAAESETEYMHDCLAWMPIPEPYKEHAYADHN